ncbi:MAG: 23S rRNA (guanosine(2251)-2'-O)-methyltransferase RlmB [Pseudomonadota bacterium]
MGRKHHHNKHGARDQAQKKSKLKIDLFGFHAVRAAWDNPKRNIHALYATEQALKDFDLKSETKRPDPIVVPKDDLDRALPQGTVHQGLALSCQPLDEVDVRDIIISNDAADKSLIVMLDQVTDPHNVGAILRSACAFGTSGMIMQSKNAPEAKGVLAKTACGAVEHVPIAYETNLSRAIETLKEAGYFVYGLDERGDDIGQVSLADKAVLVLGAEGPGIRRLVKENCDMLLRLPMSGPMPSINVSNAAAVALYALN